MRQKIHLAALDVKSIEKSIDFYTNCLGWKLSEKSTGDIKNTPKQSIFVCG